MTELTPDQKLAALFAEQAAPARDPVFCAEVMQRVARRRAWARVGTAAPWAGVAGLLAWALQPVLGPSMAAVADSLVLPAAILGGTGILLAVSLMGARRLAR
ncbi:hypothetical protein [Brevundimonas sp.]|uniref:hypothetical protein n=1 Tax=Brevundimonas sp. TaxID=1871086 RepID=UPI00391D97A3